MNDDVGAHALHQRVVDMAAVVLALLVAREQQRRQRFRPHRHAEDLVARGCARPRACGWSSSERSLLSAWALFLTTRAANPAVARPSTKRACLSARRTAAMSSRDNTLAIRSACVSTSMPHRSLADWNCSKLFRLDGCLHHCMFRAAARVKKSGARSVKKKTKIWVGIGAFVLAGSGGLMHAERPAAAAAPGSGLHGKSVVARRASLVRGAHYSRASRRRRGWRRRGGRRRGRSRHQCCRHRKRSGRIQHRLAGDRGALLRRPRRLRGQGNRGGRADVRARLVGSLHPQWKRFSAGAA